MRPYIAAWENSTHHEVDCMKCHAGKGLTGYIETKFTAASMLVNYATGIYKRSQPWAEIEDSNCLQAGCHETRLLEGEIEFTKGITFNHTPHLTESRRGRKLRCTSCHSQIVQGEHISVTTSTCFLCHFKNLEKEGREKLSACTECHTPPVGDVASSEKTFDHVNVVEAETECNSCHNMVWQGTGEVRKERCGNCHSQADHIDRINDLEFVHEWHIEKRKVECQQCHDAIEHRKPQIDTDILQNCNSCHDNQHTASSMVFQGEGIRLIESASPDSMYELGVVCLSCHKTTETDSKFENEKDITCDPCHDKGYRRLATDWRKGFGFKISRLEKEFKKAGAHPKLEDARHDLALLKKGGAWHNAKLASELLNEITVVLNQTGARTILPTDLPDASKPCLDCHSSIADIPVSLNWSSFNHKSHLSDRLITCNVCHIGGDPDNSQHGRRKQDPTACSECHHKAETLKPDCQPCHAPSRMLYTGNLPDLEPSPSPMFASEMSCTDCHIEPVSKAPSTQSCLDCHDEDILDHLEFVRGELLLDIKKSQRKGAAVEIIKLDRGRAVHHPDLAKKLLVQ